MAQNELYHHGILGMKWGIRRFQNKDGSLTSKGRQRYNENGSESETSKAKSSGGSASTTSRKRLREYSEDELKERTTRLNTEKAYLDARKNVNDSRKNFIDSENKLKSSKDKPIEKMTDQEIADRINRIRLEQTLESLQPKTLTRGEKIANAVRNGIDDVAIPAIKQAAKNQLTKYLDDKLEKMLGNDAKSSMQLLKEEAERTDYLKRIKDNKDHLAGKDGKSPEEKESERLKREADDATNRMRKARAEEYFKNSENTEKQNSETESKPSSSKTAPGLGVNKTEKMNGTGTSKRTEKNRFDTSDAVDGSYREWNSNTSTKSSTVNHYSQIGSKYMNQLLLEDKGSSNNSNNRSDGPSPSPSPANPTSPKNSPSGGGKAKTMKYTSDKSLDDIFKQLDDLNAGLLKKNEEMLKKKK